MASFTIPGLDVPLMRNRTHLNHTDNMRSLAIDSSVQLLTEGQQDGMKTPLSRVIREASMKQRKVNR